MVRAASGPGDYAPFDGGDDRQQLSDYLLREELCFALGTVADAA